MKKVLITGTSRGLGRALAIELSKRNYDVISTARNINDIKDLNVFKTISLDVTSDEQIKKIAADCGGIDILINNAAYTVAGPIEVIPIEEIKKEYETNVIGPLKLIRAFTPLMRKVHKGIIVNISSAADRFAPPYGGSYSSAKAALAMMSEALHFELKHFGIKVILIESGSIKTNMPVNQKHFSSSDYQPLDDQMKLRFEEFLKDDKRPEPSEIAKNIAGKIDDPKTNFRIPVGKDAEFMISQHSKMSEEEWLNSQMFKGLNW